MQENSAAFWNDWKPAWKSFSCRMTTSLACHWDKYLFEKQTLGLFQEASTNLGELSWGSMSSFSFRRLAFVN
jgi:hypothetical protein